MRLDLNWSKVKGTGMSRLKNFSDCFHLEGTIGDPCLNVTMLPLLHFETIRRHAMPCNRIHTVGADLVGCLT